TRPHSRSHNSSSAIWRSRSRFATSSSVSEAAEASRKRDRIRSFSSIPRRQRHRIRFSRVSSITKTSLSAIPYPSSLSATGYPARQSHRPLDQQILDLLDRERRIEVLRAHVDAVHDRVAAKEPIRILDIVEPLVQIAIAAVGHEAIGLQQSGGTDELVGVPPEGWTRRRAARAQDAFVEAVQLLALGRRLQPLALGRRRVVDEIRLHRVVLLEELAHVDD